MRCSEHNLNSHLIPALAIMYNHSLDFHIVPMEFASESWGHSSAGRATDWRLYNQGLLEVPGSIPGAPIFLAKSNLKDIFGLSSTKWRNIYYILDLNPPGVHFSYGYQLWLGDVAQRGTAQIRGISILARAYCSLLGPNCRPGLSQLLSFISLSKKCVIQISTVQEKHTSNCSDSHDVIRNSGIS